MVVLNSGTTIASSATVGSQHFGLNFLVHLDGGSEEFIVFEDIVNDLHSAGSVRFPGGTVSEIGVQRIDEYGNTFFVEPPLDISINNGNLANSTLSFLESASQNSWNVTIVLPMWRFLNENTMTIDENGSSAISTYVAAVISEASRLGVTIDGFELGNEWDILSYGTSENLTRAEAAVLSSAYANFAAELAVAVQIEISAAETSSGISVFDEETEPFIALQTLWGWMGNSSGYAEDFEAAIRTAFPIGSEAHEAVDTVLAHFYLWQAGGGVEITDPSAAYFLRNMEDINAHFGGDLDYLISEWNLQMTVRGGAQPDANTGDGIQQLEPIVGLFHTLISEGVDYANIWAVRQSSWNSLYGLEIENGMPQYVRPVRYAFDLLSDQLIGTRAIDMNGTASGSMGIIETDIHVYGFEDNNRTVLYFGSRSDRNQSINLDLQNFTASPENTLIQITRLSVDDPSLRSHLQTTTIVTEENSFEEFQSQEAGLLTFSPYELVSIEIIYRVGLGETETGTSIRDLMFGTAADDIFLGSIGEDEIFGYFGSDTVDYLESAASVNVFLNTYHGSNNSGDADGDILSSIENISGSSHNDTISGDGIANLLNGRTGNDILFGRYGNDILVGGAGDDILEGGVGDDILMDGSGSDQLFGGSGQDVFLLTADGEYDQVMDFDAGFDRLDLSSFSMLYSLDQLIFTSTGYGAEVVYRNEVIDIHSQSGGALTRSDVFGDMFIGPERPLFLTTQEQLGDNALVGGTSADDMRDAIYSYQIDSGGALYLVDSIDPKSGIWVSNMSAVLPIEMDGQIYLITTASNSNNLTALRVNEQGVFFISDFVTDTSLSGVAALDTFEVDGRGYVVAGGTNNGISLYELLPDGQLFYRQSLAQSPDLNIDLIAQISAVVLGNEVQLIVTGSEQGNVAQLILPLTEFGLQVVGDASTNQKTGGAGDDMLLGMTGNDQLKGGVDEDVLFTGSGADILTGESGADIFVFATDGQTDQIKDFEMSLDRLHLADWGRVYDMLALEISRKSFGASISWQGETINVNSENGAPIEITDWDMDSFIF